MTVVRREPERIGRILNLLASYWGCNPDLRLCQLIGNIFPGGDNYYEEDDELEKRLESMIEGDSRLCLSGTNTGRDAS